MVNSLNAQQQLQLSQLLQKHGLTRLQTPINHLAQNCIVFVSCEPDPDPQIGNSRLGGLPDVADRFKWPEHTAFMAQINLSQVAPYDVNSLFPPKGLLYFFLGSDEEHDNLENTVLYYNGDMAQLQTVASPPHYIPFENAGYEDSNTAVIYSPYTIALHKTISLPSLFSPSAQDLWNEEDELYDEEADKYIALREDLQPPRSSQRVGLNQLLGYPEVIDGEPNEMAYQFFTTDTSVGRERLPEDKPENWILLLELDSDFNVGMNFWDGGKIHFMIRREDLAELRFDSVYAGLISS